MLSNASGIYRVAVSITLNRIHRYLQLKATRSRGTKGTGAILLMCLPLIASPVLAFDLIAENGFLRWSEQDAVSINIHRGDGSYVSSLPGDASEWRATESGSYFVVAATAESWEVWEKSPVIEVTAESLDGLLELRVSEDGLSLEWTVPDTPHVINIHTGEGDYVTTVDTDSQPWTPSVGGDYFIVAATDSGWENWQKSNVVTTGTANATTDPIRLFSDGSLLLWDTAGDYLTYNIHRGDGAYVTTISGDIQQWAPPGPGNYFVVGTTLGDWTEWTRSNAFMFASDTETDPDNDPADSSVLNALNYRDVLSESLALLRADYVIEVLGDLAQAGYVNNIGRLNSELLGDPPFDTPVTRLLDCEGGGQVEIAGSLTGSSSVVSLSFDNCRHENLLFAGTVTFGNGFTQSSSSYQYGFDTFSQQNDDQSGLTLTGDVSTGDISIRGGYRRVGTSSDIVSYEHTDTDGNVTAAYDASYAQVFEIGGLESDDGSTVYDEDGSVVLALSYTEAGSATIALATVPGIVRLAIEPEISYPQIQGAGADLDYRDIPSSGGVQLWVDNETGDTVAALEVFPGSDDAATVLYEIDAGEVTRIEATDFPAARCRFATRDVACLR